MWHPGWGDQSWEGAGKDPAGVTAQGDALGNPPQPVTEPCSKKSCQWLVIVSANTISSFAAAFLR